MTKLNREQSKYYSVYIDAIVEKNAGKTLLPDANRTQRLTCGKVTGCVPADGMQYTYYTTLDGLFEKNLKTRVIRTIIFPKKWWNCIITRTLENTLKMAH